MTFSAFCGMIDRKSVWDRVFKNKNKKMFAEQRKWRKITA